MTGQIQDYVWILAIILAAILLLILLFPLFNVRQRRRATPKKPGVERGQVEPEMMIPGEGEFGLQLIDEQAKVQPLKSLPVYLGRAKANEISIEDESVSFSHARIYYDEVLQRVCIEDLGSLNGLYIDDHPTRKNVLYDGAKIRLGETKLTFRDTGYIHPA